MDLKSLFEKSGKSTRIISLKSYEQIIQEDVESVGYIEEFIKERNRFKPHIDYLTASNFAIYGSLREYYRSSISRIQQQYPYDGSLKEKIKFFSDSSGFDEFVFENQYPRTNGYIQLSSQGWGNLTSTSGAYGNPENKEYIYLKGGPNVGNVYNTASHQSSNLEINGERGNTVEFWLKKSSYESTKTQREVIFDVHTTGVLGDNHKYGRLTVELDSSDANLSPFLLTYQSGTTGFESVRVGNTQLYASASDGVWHHYAFSMKNLSGSVLVETYVDGTRNKVHLTGSSVGTLNTALVATIGSLVAPKTKAQLESTNPGLGWGKLAGYLDEFRFWKTFRNSRQVTRFWDTNVGAGSNTDASNSPLAIYYKFNEGKTGLTSIDRNVLDYSGRVSNGLWVGYQGQGRYNNSAIVEASASAKEFKDPILYANHPEVKRFTENSLETGYAYDLENNSSLYYTIPSWIIDDDGEEGDLLKITQVMGSYFDALHLQIKELTEINKIKLHNFDHKPHPFNKVKLESMGLVTPELFTDASAINTYLNRNEDEEFKQDLSDVKNYIYNNIHNNLQSIFKSKGTERSFRNLFRCFGIDNELIKLKVYSTDTEYPVETSYEPATSKVKYVNFNNDANRNASVYQDIAGLPDGIREVDCRGYVTGSEISDSTFLITDADAANIGFTTEASILFPRRYPINHSFFHSTPQSSSLFGCYSVRKNAAGKAGTNTNWTRESDDDANFQVFSVKEKLNSKTAKFVLKCRNNLFDPIESPFYKDLYENEQWHFAVKMFPEFGESSTMSGSTSTITIGLYGATAVGDRIQDSFFVTRSMDAAKAKAFAKTSKRFYIGSNRENFTDNLLDATDVKITNFRHWLAHLTNDELETHTIDISNYGVDTPSRPMFSMVDVGNAQIPKISLLAINWNFSNLTGSNTDGEMYVTDVSSGSFDSSARFGKISDIVGRIHPGKGIHFESSTTSSIDVEFDSSARLESFESVRSSDMVKILTNDDETFTRDTRPTSYYFSFEKSMYDVISDEMLSFFAGASEFSNLIGDPVERYRPSYKKMEKLREIFFSRVENSPDIERYMEYYKWLDNSLSVMIDQLVPASVDASEDIRNVIQSHALERSKYFNKFPTLEMKQSEPVGQIRGINELLYDWEHGHAPLEIPRTVTDITSVLDVKQDSDGGVIVADDGDVFDMQTGGQAVPVSFSFWHHIASDQGVGNQYLFGKFSSGANKSYSATAMYPSRRVNFNYYDTDGDGSSIISNSNTLPAPGSWVNIVITVDPGLASLQEKIYINGSLVQSRTADADQDTGANSTAALYIGNLKTTQGDPSHGQISNFVMYKHPQGGTSLSAQEVSQLYNGGYIMDYNQGPRSSEIVGWYKLEGNALDSSGNERNGSLDTSTSFAAPDDLIQILGPRISNLNNNCLWQKERSQRATDSSVSIEVDGDRETVRRISVTSVSGSTYATRRLSRPYKLTVEDQRHLKGGDNSFGNKKKRFFTGVSTAHRLSHIAITGSEASADNCKDPIHPHKKKKVRASADIAFTSKDRDVNDIAPFTLYSSSLDPISGYQHELHVGFKKGVDITNLHADEYGDDREVALQSPFTERWVGGNQHRHQDLSSSLRGRPESKRDGRSRLEAFRLLAQGGKLYVLPPNATGIDASNLPILDPSIQSAQMLREDLAKRPVNIRNIRTVTSSLSPGNFNHPYDVVQYTSEDQRKDFLIDNDQPLTPVNATSIAGIQEIPKYSRHPRKHVFNARFSAPGGPETAGDSLGGHNLDVATNQYSIYNSMNYRNMSVRFPLDYLSSVPQTASKDSNSLVTNHKVNSNPRYRRKLSAARYTGEVDLNQDNVFIRHPIPQNDYQYAWITASLIENRNPIEIAGHLHSFTQASLGSETGSLKYEKTYEFISGNFDRILDTRPAATPPSAHETYNPLTRPAVRSYSLNFVGLNIPGVNVQDHVTASAHTVASAHEHGFLSGTINYRQGPYGYPSWKQIRAGQTKMGRYLSRNNIFAPPMNSFLRLGAKVKLRSGGNYSWPETADRNSIRDTRDRRINQNFSFVDPPVSSNRHPFEVFGETRLNSITGDPQIYREKRTYSNELGAFANDSLSKLLGIQSDQERLRFKLSERDSAEEQEPVLTTIEAAQGESPDAFVYYSHEIFPKEKLAYLKKTRGRLNFKPSFWKSTDRVVTNALNSQGNVIPQLSMWCLDSIVNFDTDPISKTTDVLGSSGQGELLADYSIFHNNKTHPSASALYARPFPKQSRSSLPLATVKEFQNMLTFSKMVNPRFDITIPLAATNLAAENNRIHAPNSPFLGADTNVGGINSQLNTVPNGFTSNITLASNSTTSGPRVHNRGNGTDKLTILGVIGTSTAAGSFNLSREGQGQIPGSDTYTHYRYLAVTGGIPTITENKSLRIDFHLKTGDELSANDDFGLRTSEGPFWVQVRGSGTGNNYETVFKAEANDYNSPNTWKKVSLHLTKSFGSNVKLRFITTGYSTDSSVNRPRGWGMCFLNIFTGSTKQRQTKISLEPDNNQLFIDSMSVSASNTGHSSERTKPKVSYTNDDVLTPESNQTSVSLEHFHNFADTRDLEIKDLQANTFSTEDMAHVSGTYTYELVVEKDTSADLARLFSKNEKSQYALYGQQTNAVMQESGRNPFNFNSYEDWAFHSRLVAKDYSVIPEFRMSEHMNKYINEVGGNDPFFGCNEDLLTLTGSEGPERSSDSLFYETYSHTDFIKYFHVVSDTFANENGMTPTRLTLECKAYKKFLPYKGLYPADRMTELASEFSSSYSTATKDGLWRNILAPYYAPGIAFNSIKSGLSVDFPVFEPHVGITYNKFGVMFQSASLAVDVSGYSGDVVDAKGTMSAFPVVSGQNVNGNGASTATLSTNRIEIGGGKEWAKALTGSLADGGGSHIAASFWIYMPIGHPVKGSNSGGTFHAYGMGHLRQSGVLFSFGGKETATAAERYKSGLHIGIDSIYDADAILFNNGVNYPGDLDNYFNGTISSTATLKKPRFSIYALGGDGTTFFSKLSRRQNFHNGWNHVYIDLELGDMDSTTLRVAINGQTLDSHSRDGHTSGVGAKGLSLAGKRNCFIGNNLEETKRKTSIATSLYPGDYSDYTANFASEAASQAVLKPAELILTDICILNKPLTQKEIKSISGMISPGTAASTNLNVSFGWNSTAPKTTGPVNPYLVINESKHDNIIAWYRPGNDTGWTSKTSHNTNGLPVYNHAKPLKSGKIISTNSGSVAEGGIEHYDDTSFRNPVPLNFLSGNFYGFSEWSGSVASDLNYSDDLRQRWNGITDISNPYQYTLFYSRPTSFIKKTWFNFNYINDSWFPESATTPAVEKEAHDNATHSKSLNSLLTSCTGSTKIPTFIVGSRMNLTDDSQIPRIGSASFGTYHYLGKGNEEENVYSHGWGNPTKTPAGIKSAKRVPFEAILDPALFTPTTTEVAGDTTLKFYDIEPHPSASVLSAFTRKLKNTGINAAGQETFEWTENEFEDDNSNKFINNEKFAAGVAKDVNSLVASFDLSQAKTLGKTVYQYAAENFYAESMNFFLANKQGVTIRSRDQLQSPIDYNKTYKMKVVLSNASPVDFPMYNNPAAFGVPFDAGSTRDKNDNGDQKYAIDSLRGYGFAPYLPPHYDGFAEAIYTFVPDENRQYNSIIEVMEDTTISYSRRVSVTGSVASKFTVTDGDGGVSSYNKKYLMNLSASFNGLDKDSELSYVYSFDNDGNILENRASLVVQPKFECPNLDFSGKHPGRVSTPKTGLAKELLQPVKGMWHQTGSYGQDARRSTLSVRGEPGFADLSKLIGMRLTTDGRLGIVPSRKVVKEAVVAIPFIRTGRTRKYFYLPPNEVYQAVRELGYPDYKLKTQQERTEYEEFKEFLNSDENSENLRFPRRSIIEMVKSMLNYNIPPQFNFLKYNDPDGDYIKPFVMYLFEFSAELSQNDLALMWQNTTPDIGMDLYGREDENLVIESRVVTHELFTPNDILSEVSEIGAGGFADPRTGLSTVLKNQIKDYSGGIEGKLQWMVFKVKQKGESSFFRKKELDRLPDGHPEKVVSVEDDIYRYGFNWPYDYFSIVELVNIKATTRFQNVRNLRLADLSDKSANMLRYRLKDKER